MSQVEANAIECDRGRGDRVKRDQTIQILAATSVVGFGASVIYSMQFSSVRFLGILGTAVVISLSALVAGAAIGFLFGIPRGRRNELPPARPEPDGASGVESPASEPVVQPAVVVNTNLEDISDWLTKILVGVGLTQLGAIGGALGRLSRGLSPALGATDSSATFAMALVISYLSIGFLFGYLWTRFYIGVAFQRAEREVSDELREVRLQIDRRFELVADEQQAVKSVLALADVPGAIGLAHEDLQPLEERLSKQAEGSESLAELLRGYATEYEKVREENPQGSRRTLLMTRILTEVRGLAAQTDPDPESVRGLFQSGAGGRVIALAWISAHPDPQLVDLVIEGVAHAKTAFEQYQALRTAELLVTLLDERPRAALRSAIEDQMSGGEGKFITPDTDRWSVAGRVLQHMGVVRLPGGPDEVAEGQSPTAEGQSRDASDTDDPNGNGDT